MKTYCIFLLISLVTLSSCKNEESLAIHFNEQSSIDTIAFNYTKAGHIRILSRIDSTTFNLALDTGSTKTLFDKDLDINGKYNSVKASYSTDINGSQFMIPFTTRIPKLEIGHISLLN